MAIEVKTFAETLDERQAFALADNAEAFTYILDLLNTGENIGVAINANHGRINSVIRAQNVVRTFSDE